LRYIQISSTPEAEELLKKVGVDFYAINAMAPKMVSHNIMLQGIKPKVANIIKQEMLSIGGDAAVSRGSVDCSVANTDIVLMGTLKQLERFHEKLTVQPFGLSKIAEELKALLENLSIKHFVMKTPRREIEIGKRSLIMGIVNVTPDSFFDGGRLNNIEEAERYALQMAEDGADILDIGGESTRPGSAAVDTAIELKRIIPLVKKLVKNISIPISIDTTKSEVARAALDEGAEIINDISAMRFDRQMADVAVKYGSPVILMHMRGTPRTMQKGNIVYRDLMGEILEFLKKRILKALSFGMNSSQMVIDPGFGFGKTVRDNVKILKHLRELKSLGLPIVVGTSRKYFTGEITETKTPSDRIEGTAATVSVAIQNGADIIRVHDVKFMKRVALMTDAVVRG
jgi:dihydropteroate synthase